MREVHYPSMMLGHPSAVRKLGFAERTMHDRSLRGTTLTLAALGVADPVAVAKQLLEEEQQTQKSELQNELIRLAKACDEARIRRDEMDTVANAAAWKVSARTSLTYAAKTLAIKLSGVKSDKRIEVIEAWLREMEAVPKKDAAPETKP